MTGKLISQKTPLIDEIQSFLIMPYLTKAELPYMFRCEQLKSKSVESLQLLKDGLEYHAEMTR